MAVANELISRISKSLSIAGTTVGGTVQTVLGDEAVVVQKSLAIGTNLEIDVAVNLSQVVAMGIEADKDCTVKTNNSTTPDDTVVLKAGQPLMWITGDPAGTQFFTADVTKFFVTTTVVTVVKFVASLTAT